MCYGSSLMVIVRKKSMVALSVKTLPDNARDIKDAGTIPASGRSSGGGHGNQLQYSCLENPHGQRSLVGYSSPWESQRVRHD